jgi:pimeloyl-ACP methyl ester carboxylesterase
MSRISAILLLVLACAPGTAACLPDGIHSFGAVYRICMPEPGKWNGQLVLFAHGYVAFNEPVAIPEDQLVLADGTTLPSIVNGLGYAFATSSYRMNGLAILPGVEDMRDLVTVFEQRVGRPTKVFLTGASEGGIISALSIERYPQVYTGALAACGPVGDFPYQVNYLGDFRVVFDYFFPGVLPGSADSVPPEVIANWETNYVPAIRRAVAASPDKARQLASVTKVALNREPDSLVQTFIDVLWYSAFTTNDARAKLTGQPFGNRERWYFGSKNDVLLNIFVKRFSADPAAVEEMKKYNTSGNLVRPLVALHTTGDQIIPFFHEWLYQAKVNSQGAKDLFWGIPVFRYGHCNFEAIDVLFAFAGLLLKDAQQLPQGAETVLPTAQRGRFRDAVRESRLPTEAVFSNDRIDR